MNKKTSVKDPRKFPVYYIPVSTPAQGTVITKMSLFSGIYGAIKI